MRKSRSRDTANSIKRYVLRLINIKDRSEKELLERLRSKGYPEELIHKTIKYFKNIGLVNDRVLANSIVRLCEDAKPLGTFACKQYLKRRGIPEDIIKEITFSFDGEKVKARKLITKKQKSLKNYSLKDKLNKIYGLLQRRGFDRETISEVLREYKLNQQGHREK